MKHFSTKKLLGALALLLLLAAGYSAYAATSATSSTKPLGMSNAKYSDGYSFNIKCNADGTFTVGVQVDIKNNSGAAIDEDTAGENYSITLAAMNNTNPYEPIALKTVKLPSLGDGETQTVYIADTFTLPEIIKESKFDASNGYYRFRLDIINNYATAQDTYIAVSGWAEVTPYSAILDINYDKISTSNGSKTNTQVDSTKYQEFGTFVASRTIDYRLRNRGSAPLEILSVDKPDWITIEDLPQSIEPDGTETIKVTVGGTPGYKKGEIRFNTNGMAMVSKMLVSGEVVGEDVFFADFESSDALDQWYMPASSTAWELGNYTTAERDASNNYVIIEYGFNDGRLSNSHRPSSSNGYIPSYAIYSPKMAFVEGDKVSFYAAKKTNSGEDIMVKALYSTDRVNWEELGTITVTNNDDPNLQFSSGTSSTPSSAGQNILKRYEFPMPAGQYYISLDAAYVLIDNFVGGVPVEVDYDIVGESSAAGATKIVNNPLEFSATFKNLAPEDINPDIQVVSLYANGEKVASATPDTIKGNGSVTYKFVYTPHEAGETELYAEIAIGEFKANSPTVNAKIQPEMAVKQSHIGTRTQFENSYAVLATNWHNSMSEFVYTKEDLAAIGGSAKILQISYEYYKTAAEHVGDTLVVYMQNTTEAECGSTFEDTTQMTKVAEIVGFVFETKGSNTDPVDLVITLDTPFDYAGDNLRVTIESLASDFKQSYWGVDGSTERKALVKKADNNSGLRTTYRNTKAAAYSKMPVISLYTELPVAQPSGTVKDTDGKPVIGAEVKAESGDVYYKAVTDSAGEWSMTIFQDTLAYTVTASAPGYVTSDPVALDMEGANDIVLQAINWGQFIVSVTGDDAAATPMAGVDVVLLPVLPTADSADAKAPQATTDSAGVAVFTDLTFGSYTVTVPAAGIFFSAYEGETPVDHEADTTAVDVVLKEIVYAPVSHDCEYTENADGTYSVEITWEMASADSIKADSLPGYTFAVTVDDAKAVEADKAEFAIENLEAGSAHTVSIVAISPFGTESAAYELEVKPESKNDDGGDNGDNNPDGIESIVVDGSADWKYFDLRGVEIKAEQMVPGVYIRSNGTSTEKVYVK